MHILPTLIYLPIVIAMFVVAAVGYIYRSQKYLAYFATFVSVTGLWLLCQYIAQLSIFNAWSLDIMRTSSALSGFIGYLFLLFVSSYINHRKLQAIQKYYIVPILFLVPFNFTNLMIQHVEASSAGISIKEAGMLYFAEVLFVFLYFVRGIFELIKATLRAPKYARGKNYLLIFGIGLAATISAIGVVFFASSAQSQFMIPVAILLMVVIIAFAVIKHRLFDIRSIVVKAVVYLTSVAVLGVIYGTLIIAVINALLHAHISTISQIFLSVVLATISISFASFKQSFDRITSRIFFQDTYDTQELFDQLNRVLLSTFDINELLTQVSNLLTIHIKAQSCTFEIDATDYATQRLIGSSKGGDKYGFDEMIAAGLKLNRRIMVVNEFEAGSSVKRLMDKDNVALIVYLASGQNINDKGKLGAILLGPKKSGNPYNSQDLRVVSIIANELVIAIQNALRFEEIQNFNTTLQTRVQQATKELRRTNDKLRALDETKDEFITMASHQLRTPLTSVKGYLSMVLEGDAGKLNKQQTQLLTQSFISSQRMVYLIADLLNLSRLNTGKFVIEPIPVDLRDVVQGEIDQLTETAKSRDLKLVYERPESFPTLMLDETKIHQVVMNFIDNAIYYTPTGGTINVELRETPTAVEYLVKDNGIGVPKSEQHHLFTKFYRAGNARRARPDGTGLGLFMAKKVIIAQGGSIIFQSEEGKGSTFGFRFTKAHHMTTVSKQVPAQAK